MTERRPSSSVPRLLAESEPLATQLDDSLDEARVKAMWQRIDHAPPSPRWSWRAALVTATVVALLLAVSRFWPTVEVRQLALASGNMPNVLGSDSAAVSPLFDDGSRVDLASGARLEVLRNDARSFVTTLRRGDATFDVKPGGPRHWVVEAGEVTVEVVGTRFRVERGAQLTRVSVEHGIVLVRGERVPDGSVRLTGGNSFALPTVSGAPRASVSAPASPNGPVEAASPTPVVEASASPSAVSALSARSQTSANPAAEPAARDEVELSLRAADLARRERDSAAALRHFEAAFLKAPAGDPRRGLAGLSMARLLIGHAPAQAARILRSSLADMPQALLEDASVRLVEAESRAGNREAAARAAADYRRRFPLGQRDDEVRRWSEP